MKGWVSVGADGFYADADFERWVARGLGFARYTAQVARE